MYGTQDTWRPVDENDLGAVGGLEERIANVASIRGVAGRGPDVLLPIGVVVVRHQFGPLL